MTGLYVTVLTGEFVLLGGGAWLVVTGAVTCVGVSLFPAPPSSPCFLAAMRRAAF